MGCTRSSEAALDALDHQIADHLAGDAGGRRDPPDDLAIMAVEGKGDTHHLAVPAGELKDVRAPADVGPERHDAAVVLAGPSMAGVARQEQPVLLHQAVDALGIDGCATAGSPLAPDKGSDPAIAVGWSLIDEAADFGGQLEIALAALRPALRARAFDALGN